MEQKICQSCAMPLTSEDMYATEKDGSINKDYCKKIFPTLKRWKKA